MAFSFQPTTVIVLQGALAGDLAKLFFAISRPSDSLESAARRVRQVLSAGDLTAARNGHRLQYLGRCNRREYEVSRYAGGVYYTEASLLDLHRCVHRRELTCLRSCPRRSNGPLGAPWVRDMEVRSRLEFQGPLRTRNSRPFHRGLARKPVRTPNSAGHQSSGQSQCHKSIL